MQREFIKSPIDIVIDSAFGIPTTAWLTYGDKRLLTAKASKEFAGLTSIGTLSLKIPGDLYWSSERGKRNRALAYQRWQEYCRVGNGQKTS